jgi:glycosyltransferase involved in cell wall biosynthesis
LWKNKIKGVKMATKKIIFNSSSLPSISLSMIVKNESENLKKLLPIVKGMVDEIVVVDTGSTDDTKQVAESFGAIVYDFPWCDDFSAARNESISHCTKDYVLWMDGDDYIERQDIAKLKWFLKDNPDRAVFLGLLDKRWDRDFQSVQLRVFPNNKGIKFEGKVHEQLSFSVEGMGMKYATCDITVYHLGYESADAIKVKLNRNLEILIKDLNENQNSFLDLVNIAKTLTGLERTKEVEPYIERALNLIRKNETNVSTENEFIAILTKLNLLSSSGRQSEIMPLMNEFKTRFEHLPMFRFTYGEVSFKFKEYGTAYKFLLPLRDGKLNLGLIPVDAQTLLRNMNILLLSSSLAIGDFRTAEICISRIIMDPEFKIKRR